MKKRIKLEPTYQRKLCEEAKRESGLTWGELAKRVRVSKAYLKTDLCYERVTLPKNVYEKLCKLVADDYDDRITAVLDPNWGRAKGGSIGGRLSKPRPTRLLVDHPSPELAEALGIMLGDGNSWMKHGFYYVRVSGNSEDDKNYLLHHVRPLFSKVFKIQFDVSVHKKCKEMRNEFNERPRFHA